MRSVGGVGTVAFDLQSFVTGVAGVDSAGMGVLGAGLLGTGVLWLTALATVLLLAMLVPIFRRWEKPGTSGFLLVIFGAVVYSLATVGKTVAGSGLVWFLTQNFVLLGAAFVAVGWVLMAVEYTGLVDVTWQRVTLLLSFPVATQLVVWSNPVHHRAYPPVSEIDPASSVANLEAGFLPLLAGGYAFLALGTGLFGYYALVFRGVRRRQSAVLFLAAVPALIGNLLFRFGIIQVDPTPLGFIVACLVIGWGLFRIGLLEVAPVGRREVYEHIDDPVVTLDASGRVVDCNRAARDLAGVGPGWEQTPIGEFFEAFPDRFDRMLADGGTDETLCVTIDGVQRHFDVTSSPVADEAGSRGGRVVILRDVSELKQKESQLDLIRRVQSRVLRHNLRNELMLVAGYTETLLADLEDDQRERAEQVVETTQDLIDTSEKARAAEQLIDGDQTPSTVDIVASVEDIVESCSERFPEVSFELDVPDSRVIETIPAMELAMENIIENAAEHNDANDPRVELTVSVEEDETTVVTVADNGPGIPEHELRAVERGEETPLEHGSGVGLWVVDWVVDNADATIDYRTGEGTTARLRISS